MKRYLTLLTASLLAVCALAQTQFTSGKFKYEVIEGTDNWVQIIPKSTSESGAGYSNLVSSDFKTSVTYNDVTYTVVGIGANAFYRCKLNEQAICGRIFLHRVGLVEVAHDHGVDSREGF